MDNEALPDLITTVDGTLHVERVNIVDGFLTGTGSIEGNLNLFGPVSGYADPIQMVPVGNEPVDPSWDNPMNTIRGTTGASLVPGERPKTVGGNGTPGKLSVSGDVTLNNATFTVYATGSATQGTDYSWLASTGQVSLGNSKLDLSLIGFKPQPGTSFTIITAAKGISGTFNAKDNTIKVGDVTFNITYNKNSVVLTAAQLGAGHSPVNQLYSSLLNRDADPAGLAYWNGQLDKGASREAVAQAFLNSAEHRGIQVDGYYQEFLHRSGDPQGRAAWVSALQSGMSETAVQVRFLSSPEYLALHADAASIVNGIFTAVLGRPADPASLSFWESAAKIPAGEASVAQGIIGSTEADTIDIKRDYQEFLGREADDQGLNMWLALLAQHQLTLEQVDLAILTSDEFFGIQG
jgi:Domain of unknown function (DUF4214)